MKNPIKELCRDMANNPVALTFSDLAQAAATGASLGQKTGSMQGAWIGAVLGISLEAGKRAVEITETMLSDFTKDSKIGSNMDAKDIKLKTKPKPKNKN